MDTTQEKKTKILLIGYGKMGQTIHQMAQNHHCEVVGMLNHPNDAAHIKLAGADVAIEFTQPDQALSNIEKCFEANLPIVVGTTGWYDHFNRIKQLANKEEKRLFTATNFSLGVNLFLAFNHKIAEILNKYPEYSVNLHEIHHTEKQDAPSGTAITLADSLVANLDHYDAWQLQTPKPLPATTLPISFERRNLETGTHIVTYSSKNDIITMQHTSRSREGFALGAILAAKWLVKQAPGAYGMQDFLKIF